MTSKREAKRRHRLHIARVRAAERSNLYNLALFATLRGIDPYPDRDNPAYDHERERLERDARLLF